MSTLRLSVPRFAARVLSVGIVAGLVITLALAVASPKVWAAACPAPGSDLGTVTTSTTVPATATYRVWSRILAPDTTNNSYYLEIDGKDCFSVGGTGTPANSWTWVDYKDDNKNSKVNISLSQGQHTLKLIGKEQNLKLDRVIFVSDLNCVPKSISGSECDTPDDSTPPTVKLTAPAANSIVSGTFDVTADATDNVGVKKVEFYVDSTLKSSDTTSPYSFRWNTTEVKNGQYLLLVKAYDAANNVSSDSYRVTVQNGDREAPSVPSEIKATATAYNKVNVSWKASTDSAGIANYTVMRDGVPVAIVEDTTYDDAGLTADTEYAYQVLATDKTGNKSDLSDTAAVRTPKVADSTAPTAPKVLTATAVSSRQINLVWSGDTDNIGVKSYDIYRSGGGAKATKIATVLTTSFGDTGLKPSTTYTYYIIARDASGNASPASPTAKAKTQSLKRLAAVNGVVRGKETGKPIVGTTVIVTAENTKYIYTTNKKGEYLVRGLEPGRYNLTYRAEGYSSKTFSAKLSNQLLTKNVTLQKR